MEKYYIESESLIESSEGIHIGLMEPEFPSQSASPHIHSQVELLYIITGRFRVLVNDTEFLLNDGELIFFPKYAIHSIYALSPNGGKYHFFHIHPSVISEMSKKSEASFFQFFFSLESPSKKLLWTKEELLKNDFTYSLSTIIRAYDENNIFSFSSAKIGLFNLLLAIMRDSYARDALSVKYTHSSDNMLVAVQKTIEYINTNYASDINAKALANTLGYNYKYFLRSFSEITGDGFRQYLNKTRIKFAKNLLLNSRKPITEISHTVGYNSDSHFILEFKKQTGITPLQFTKLYRDKSKYEAAVI